MKALGEWVRRQRRSYKDLKEGKMVRTMTQDRVEKLESIGFVWVSPGYKYSSVKCQEVDWETSFQDLKKYKEAHGHCNVPRGVKSLGLWGHNQRINYKHLEEGKKMISMSPERVAMLESINFNWVAQHGKPVWVEETSDDGDPLEKVGRSRVECKVNNHLPRMDNQTQLLLEEQADGPVAESAEQINERLRLRREIETIFYGRQT